MTFAHRLLTVAACVLSAQAVNIMLYTSDDCSGTADVTCTNIGVNSCCVAGGSDESALFNGLPTEGVPAQGGRFFRPPLVSPFIVLTLTV